jgi:hypothetical protein
MTELAERITLDPAAEGTRLDPRFGASAFLAAGGLVLEGIRPDGVEGVNNNTNFVGPFMAGRVEVAARPLQQGRTQQLWQVDIVDRSKRLIATGQLRLANVVTPASGPASDAGVS